MRVDTFDFALPDDRIALRPAEPRDSARLLVVCAGRPLLHRHVRDLPDLLRPGDCLVLNDTRVISARLRGKRISRGSGAAKVEVLLHKRISNDSFLAFARPARKLAQGDELLLGTSLGAHVRRRGEAGEIELKFRLAGFELDSMIQAQGEIPLPPYIASRRKADEQDRADYQTVFARHDGSVAAPTAGLHFTADLFKRLSERDIGHEWMTLHVGAGTFLPVSAADTAEHHMHPESFRISDAALSHLNAVKGAGRRIVAIGTTALRALETVASREGRLSPGCTETSIFMTPGYTFKAVDVLLTNFHLPRSTLFMLVCAFCGLDVMQAAYAEAICDNYRFYSYGDACLLFRPTQ